MSGTPGNALRALLRICCVTALVAATGCAGISTLTRTSNGERLEFVQALPELTDARLILVGERHDEERHHRMQLQVIDALRARGKQVAIAAEMFTAASQPELELWNDGRMDELTFRWLYSDNWSEPWPLYRDIFLYAREHRIPIVGLNFEKALMHKVSTQGLASLTAKESSQLPAVSCDRNSPYTRFLESSYETHAGRIGSFENYCIAQDVWNKGMARHILEYLKLHPEKTVVAIVGSYHAVRPAIPAAVAGLDGRILVPKGVGLDAAGPLDADFLY
jgi:uncharacterized iron-regulated protein